MKSKPSNESGKKFLEWVKANEPRLTPCQKCACFNCINYDKCRWEMCKDCGSGEHYLPCKDFERIKDGKEIKHLIIDDLGEE